MKKILFVVVVVVLIVAAGVFWIKGRNSVSVPAPVPVAGATSASIASVVNGNNQFAFDYYSRLSKSAGNIFFSPYSLTTALGMVYEGAKGQTASEMKSVLHISGDDAGRRNAVRNLYDDLNAEHDSFALKTANALWMQKSYSFLSDYISLVETYYGGKASEVDFMKAPDSAVSQINSWVKDQTDGKISDLLSMVDPATRLILTNAIYFKGKWSNPFEKSSTQKADFKVDSNTTIKTDMMTLSEKYFNYADNKDAQVLELPYVGNKISMLVILPKSGESIDLSADKLASLRSSMHKTKVDVYLPKFSMKTEYSLADDLSAMGMRSLFGPADLSGITGNTDLQVSRIIHKAVIDVDEQGTEAAAVTGVMMSMGSFPAPSPVFRADHPFIFIIQDTKTGEILFIGRLTNPTK